MCRRHVILLKFEVKKILFCPQDVKSPRYFRNSSVGNTIQTLHENRRQVILKVMGVLENSSCPQAMVVATLFYKVKVVEILFRPLMMLVASLF